LAGFRRFYNALMRLARLVIFYAALRLLAGVFMVGNLRFKRWVLLLLTRITWKHARPFIKIWLTTHLVRARLAFFVANRWAHITQNRQTIVTARTLALTAGAGHLVI